MLSWLLLALLGHLTTGEPTTNSPLNSQHDSHHLRAKQQAQLLSAQRMIIFSGCLEALLVLVSLLASFVVFRRRVGLPAVNLHALSQAKVDVVVKTFRRQARLGRMLFVSALLSFLLCASVSTIRLFLDYAVMTGEHYVPQQTLQNVYKIHNISELFASTVGVSATSLGVLIAYVTTDVKTHFKVPTMSIAVTYLTSLYVLYLTLVSGNPSFLLFIHVPCAVAVTITAVYKVPQIKGAKHMLLAALCFALSQQGSTWAYLLPAESKIQVPHLVRIFQLLAVSLMPAATSLQPTAAAARSALADAIPPTLDDVAEAVGGDAKESNVSDSSQPSTDKTNEKKKKIKTR